LKETHLLGVLRKGYSHLLGIWDNELKGEDEKNLIISGFFLFPSWASVESDSEELNPFFELIK